MFNSGVDLGSVMGAGQGSPANSPAGGGQCVGRKINEKNHWYLIFIERISVSVF